MTKYDQYVTESRQQTLDWFRTHQATLITHSENVHELKWSRPDSSAYSATVWFCDNNLIFTGDLGKAIYSLTWIPSPHENWNANSLDYFTGKLSAVDLRESAEDFNMAVCLENLELQIEASSDFDRLKRIIEEEYITTKEEWISFIESEQSLIHGIDEDYWEWMGEAGNVPSRRMITFHTLIQVATENLRNTITLK